MQSRRQHRYIVIPAPVARVILAIAILSALIVPAIALASSYTGTLSFSVSLEGAPRVYDGQNISISMTAHPSAYHRLNQTFQVTLQRKFWFWYTTVGSASFPRDGYAEATWTNVGSGTYRFYFVKANDGVRITSNDVKMFN